MERQSGLCKFNEEDAKYLEDNGYDWDEDRNCFVLTRPQKTEPLRANTHIGASFVLPD